MVAGNAAGNGAGHWLWRDVAMTTPLLNRIAATVETARTRGPARVGLSPPQLAALEAIAGARGPLAICVSRAAKGGLPVADAEALVVASALEAVLTGEATGTAALASATWRLCRAALRREQRFAARHLRPTLTEEASLAKEPVDTTGAALLSWAVGAGILSACDAELVALTRSGESSVRELAADRGVSAWTLVSARRRAEARLRAALDDETGGDPCGG